MFFKRIILLAEQLLYALTKGRGRRTDYLMLSSSLSSARTEEIPASVDQPDVLAGHEYLDAYRRKSHLGPETDLIFAVLEDAVRCDRAYAFARSPISRRLYRDAEKWLWKNDWQWAFSFRNICQVLALEPFCLRRGLLRWKEAHTETESFGKARVCRPRRRTAAREEARRSHQFRKRDSNISRDVPEAT